MEPHDPSPRCRYCANSHWSHECLTKIRDGKALRYHCVNYDGDHHAEHYSCPKYPATRTHNDNIALARQLHRSAMHAPELPVGTHVDTRMQSSSLSRARNTNQRSNPWFKEQVENGAPTARYTVDGDTVAGVIVLQIHSRSLHKTTTPKFCSCRTSSTISHKDTEVQILKEQIAEMNDSIHLLAGTMQMVIQGMQKIVRNTESNTETVLAALQLHGDGRHFSTSNTQ